MLKIFYLLLEVLVVIVPVLLAVAFMTIIERKALASFQRRVGPNTFTESVKEHRVDRNLKFYGLRCTLKGLRIIYSVNLPFNQINKVRKFSTVSDSNIPKDIKLLNPYFITGFSDAEGSFMILILREPRSKTG
jgi:hypothetical protein